MWLGPTDVLHRTPWPFFLREPLSLALRGTLIRDGPGQGAYILLCLVNAGIRTGHGVSRFGPIHPALLNLKRKYEGWDWPRAAVRLQLNSGVGVSATRTDAIYRSRCSERGVSKWT